MSCICRWLSDSARLYAAVEGFGEASPPQSILFPLAGGGVAAVLLWRRSRYLAATLIAALAAYFLYNVWLPDWHGGAFGLRRLTLLAPWWMMGWRCYSMRCAAGVRCYRRFQPRC